MSDLAEFLLARFAEDEASVTVDVRYGDPHGVRVVAECAAKRRIVEECARILAVKWWEYEDAPDLADLTLSALALPYADHPDYREEWKRSHVLSPGQSVPIDWGTVYDDPDL